MAEEFLHSLPQVGEADLPEGSECGICQEKYGKADPQTGTVDTPVRLPCQHILGSDCISRWVSPDEHGKNTCPFCRYVFFYSDPVFDDTDYFASDHGFDDTDYREVAELYRTIQPPGITDADRQVARLSLRANERLLYEEFLSEGCPLPALNEWGTLDPRQEEALFEELVEVRAFEGLLGHMSWTDYEILWHLLREDGFVFVQDFPAMGGVGWRTTTAAGSWYFVPSDAYAWPSGSGSLIGDL